MPRLLGVDIPGDKRIEASLPYIYGLGPSNSKKILEQANIDPNIRAKDLSPEQLNAIIVAINANKIDRQRVNLKLGRSFLNDKVIVNVGGDLDFNVRSSTNIQNDNLQWLPDLNIEFILTRDRKLRAIVFNRNSLDINGSSLGRRNRQGVSISYRKDFEKFLF
jgi:ribosomal protein S13